jgi:CBS domain-containing protein
MPDSIVKETLREMEPLDADELVGPAARRVIEAGLPALPAVEADGRFAGIFGEREFMAALFPGYVGELASAAMVSRSVDETIERRSDCAQQPIRRYLTTDHVVVEDEYSDTQLAEIFLHHRVLIVPIATRGRVHAIVTRHDFFCALVERFGVLAEDLEDLGT